MRGDMSDSFLSILSSSSVVGFQPCPVVPWTCSRKCSFLTPANASLVNSCTLFVFFIALFVFNKMGDVLV